MISVYGRTGIARPSRAAVIKLLAAYRRIALTVPVALLVCLAGVTDASAGRGITQKIRDVVAEVTSTGVIRFVNTEGDYRLGKIHPEVEALQGLLVGQYMECNFNPIGWPQPLHGVINVLGCSRVGDRRFRSLSEYLVDQGLAVWKCESVWNRGTECW